MDNENFMSQFKIVVVEDEPDILDLVTYNLKREGYEVESTEDGAKALHLITKSSPDLVILDLMLPGVDGLEICRRMKENPTIKDIPIIMMTAKSEESDIVLGLGLGADDYVAKPFRPKELIARVKAVLRRSDKQSADNATTKSIAFGAVVIHPELYQLSINGEAVSLTLSEFRILCALASEPNRVLSREQLLRKSLGDQVVVVDRNIDVHIRSIRKALKEYAQMIETVRGVGYRFRT